MLVLHERPLAWRLAIEETVRTIRVQAQNPVTNDLRRYAADLGRLATRRSVVNRGEGPAADAPCGPSFERLASARSPPASKSSRNPIAAAMANLLVFANTSLTTSDSGIPSESDTTRVGVTQGNSKIPALLLARPAGPILRPVWAVHRGALRERPSPAG
jgi:hypothetical protein